jgi:CelD/BcsL family acetyltransferase involved in cellulose biosynthesis
MKKRASLHRRHAPLPVVALESIGNASTRLDFIYRDLQESYLHALWEYLVEQEDWHALRCPLEEESATVHGIRKFLLGRNTQIILTRAQSSPYAAIPESWDAFQRTLSSNFRKQLRRAAKSPGVSFEIVDAVSGLDRALPEVFDVAAKGWAGAEGTAISSTPQLRAFYTDLSYQAARHGWLFLSILRQEGKCIAFSYDLRYGDRIYSTKTAFDPNYASLSPGHLLTAFLMEHVCNHLSGNIKEYEMLGEAEPYKLRWTQLQRPHIKTHIYHPSKLYARVLNWAHSRFRFIRQAQEPAFGAAANSPVLTEE